MPYFRKTLKKPNFPLIDEILSTCCNLKNVIYFVKQNLIKIGV